MGMEKFDGNICVLPPQGYDAAREGISYPQITKLTYFSETAGRETPVNLLLPADFSEQKKYPVLYLLHGFFDSEDWMARPEVALPQILTNLQADGQAEEMIVVMPYIYCSRTQPAVTGMDPENCLAYDNFINDLKTSLMPFIESRFPVLTGRENTAITGFSMGGREALFIGLSLPEVFGYVGAVCPAPGLVSMTDRVMPHKGQIEKEDMRFPAENKPFRLFISSSKADGVVTFAPDSYRQIFTENGEPFLSHIMEETLHDHTSVKPHLYNYLRMIFR